MSMYALYAACTHPMRTRFLPELRHKWAHVRMYAGKRFFGKVRANKKVRVHAYNRMFWVDFSRISATNRVRKTCVQTAYIAYMCFAKE